tara:strand:- start:401 stop:1180 length:780 start_codon:yes stop_codon:yes gene_type:complete
MLSFSQLQEKKTKVIINPKKDQVMEAPDGLKKNHGEDCDCKKCDTKRRKEELQDEPEISTEETAYVSQEKVTEESNQESDSATKLLTFNQYNEESIKMSRKEYSKIHKDFKSDDPKNPRTTRYVKGKGTVSSPVTFTDEYVPEATRLKKEKGYDVGGTKKPAPKSKSDKPSALDIVRASITKQYGKGAIMNTSGSRQQKKVRGAKDTRGTGKYKKAADEKKQTAADAKKRGFKDSKSYRETMARYGGKDNYDKGRGLGT